MSLIVPAERGVPLAEQIYRGLRTAIISKLPFFSECSMPF
jgi:hypothetical protein